ncbi:DUF2515 family protein [Paenibacillus montanisoli]|uniref:DUF2515 domain-containing protein n=1 Tax=Paenibacillus montanisoli TaxID=2081970 RepID=A0A328U5U6_9BACL|nr:DUF2515 family protein [Paenibacillus montanisoli]RAP78137.1 DUF2515 domain-containing protein [Paenibacillus montanisoli]
MEQRHTTGTSFFERFVLALRRLPARIAAYVQAKRKARRESELLSRHAVRLELKPESVRELNAAWLASAAPSSPASADPLFASADAHSERERALIQRILQETEKANRNNVTRTEAYRALYFRCPELHWALLAHLVSRNGGWNMTDLQGELLPRLLGRSFRKHAFLLLERANALIFQDAYPQLLLYEASRKEGREHFGLLPAFGVSRFMRPVWSQFWRRRDAAILTTALIVNEQNVIEEPIVRSAYFKEHVLRQPAFLLQAPLQTNSVFMPYGAPSEDGMKLAGLVLENFRSLQERIEFGKRLYAILFGVTDVKNGVLAFVRAVPHTGSRADYAPQLFTKQPRNTSAKGYAVKLDGCKLKRGARKLSSPELEMAWQDVPVEIGSRSDWFTGSEEAAEEVAAYFKALPLPDVFEITEEHCSGIKKIELAVMAAQRIKPAVPLQEKRR